MHTAIQIMAPTSMIEYATTKLIPASHISAYLRRTTDVFKNHVRCQYASNFGCMLAYAWCLSNVNRMHATKEKSFLDVFETRPGRILDVLLWDVCYKHTRIRFS